MNVFGWIVLVLIAGFGLFNVGLILGPSVISSIKMFNYKIKKHIEERRIDIDKKSEEKQRRDDILREKLFQLKNKKLESKLAKIDKKIKIQEQRAELAAKLEALSNEPKIDTTSHETIKVEQVVEKEEEVTPKADIDLKEQGNEN